MQNNRSFKHFFKITTLKQNEDIHVTIKNMIEYSINKRKKYIVKYKILGENEILFVEYNKSVKIPTLTYSDDNYAFDKIPYKQIFDTYSYFVLNMNNLAYIDNPNIINNE